MVQNKISNAPSDGARLLIVFGGNIGDIITLITQVTFRSNGDIHYRTRGKTDWSEWKQIQSV